MTGKQSSDGSKPRDNQHSQLGQLEIVRKKQLILEHFLPSYVVFSYTGRICHGNTYMIIISVAPVMAVGKA